MKKTIETAAEKYARIKAERTKAEPLFTVTSPSGMEWQLRKPKLKQFVLNGLMPMDLTGRLAEAMQKTGGNAEKAMQSLDWQDQVRSMEFDNFLVRYCAVLPRIVEHPQGPDEVGFDIESDDHEFILQWAIQGGGEAESLDTFPAK